MMMTLTETDVNIVKLTRGLQFRRYETAKGCAVSTLHTEEGPKGTMPNDEAMGEIGSYMAVGWRVVAV